MNFVIQNNSKFMRLFIMISWGTHYSLKYSNAYRPRKEHKSSELSIMSATLSVEDIIMENPRRLMEFQGGIRISQFEKKKTCEFPWGTMEGDKCKFRRVMEKLTGNPGRST